MNLAGGVGWGGRRGLWGGSWGFGELRSRANKRLICSESVMCACACGTILFPRLRPRHAARQGRETKCINAQSHRNVSRLPRTRNKQTRCLEETAGRQGRPRAWNTFERVLAHGKANDGPNESYSLQALQHLMHREQGRLGRGNIYILNNPWIRIKCEVGHCCDGPVFTEATAGGATQN